jgi:hypothetical protein
MALFEHVNDPTNETWNPADLTGKDRAVRVEYLSQRIGAATISTLVLLQQLKDPSIRLDLSHPE